MASPRHDWYFNDWLAVSNKTQADLERDLGWNKAKASLFASGGQRYHRDDINALAAYLNAEPFELLLPPDRAMAYRQYRASAEKIVTLAHEAAEPADMLAERNAREKKPARRGTGTHG